MNRRLLLVLAVVGLLLVGAMLFIPALMAGFSGRMGVQFYDPQGNPVGAPFAFVWNDVVVTEFEVTVSYSTSVTGGSTESFSIVGSVVCVAYVNRGGGEEGGRTSASLSSSQESGTFVQRFSLGFIDPNTDSGYGWTVTISAHLQASATLDGQAKTSTWDGQRSFTLSWQEGQLVLTGEVVVA